MSAFFSGCVTTTVDTLFPTLDPVDRPDAQAPVAYVDVPARRDGEAVTHEREEVRGASLAANLRTGVDLLDGYQRRHSRVETSQLHCYLPARAIGAPVEFRPHNPADPSLNGLLDLTDEQITRMRDGLLVKLGAVLGAILAGEGRSDVYALWRKVCARDVRLAEERRGGVPPIPLPSFDVEAVCAAIRSRQVRVERSGSAPEGEAVNIALAVDGNLKSELAVVVDAMVAHCSRPLHLWVLCREHGSADFRRFAAAFPEVSVTWLPCDAVDHGRVPGMLKHITISTMDRLLLPDLLPELDRIVYHDLDALPLSDLAELYDFDLTGQPLAARSTIAEHVVSGFGNIWRAARRSGADPARASDLLRRVHARHAFDFAAFNAGIMVLDLARMRADKFTRDYLPYVEQYGMNDQEVLNCYAGPNRAVLPPEWNALPTQEPLSDPKIVHWAGPLKPWQREYVLFREVWEQHATRAELRFGAEPTPATVTN